MHSTLFEEDNEKQGRQLRLWFEYSNVEHLYGMEWVTSKDDSI